MLELIMNFNVLGPKQTYWIIDRETGQTLDIGRCDTIELEKHLLAAARDYKVDKISLQAPQAMVEGFKDTLHRMNLLSYEDNKIEIEVRAIE